MLDRRGFVSRIGLLTLLAAAAGLPAFAHETPQETGSKKKYVCPPCPCGEDHIEHDAPGACPACGMPLVEKGAARPAPTSSPQTPAQPPQQAGGASAGAAKPDQKPASPTPPQ